MGKRWVTVVKYPSHNTHYYRLTAGTGQTIELQLHVPGGRVGNPIVEGRVEELRSLIKQGKTAKDLAPIVKGWGRGWAKKPRDK